MTDLIHLNNEVQLKELIDKIKTENKILKEKLEFFTDKYGIPDNWKEDFAFQKLIEKSADETPENVSDLRTNESSASKSDNITDLHNRLVAESIAELLKVQLSDILETLAAQNRHNVQAYNAVLSLKEKLKTLNK